MINLKSNVENYKVSEIIFSRLLLLRQVITQLYT